VKALTGSFWHASLSRVHGHFSVSCSCVLGGVLFDLPPARLIGEEPTDSDYYLLFPLFFVFLRFALRRRHVFLR
jgi:hypothetical protein